MKPRVLVLTPYFLPGEQGGGSVLAVRYLVEHLRDEFEFVIATGDRDFGAGAAYTPEQQAQTRALLGAEVHHLPAGPAGRRALRALMQQPFDLLYLNSLLSLRFGLLAMALQRWGGLPHRPVLMAPRGELKAELLRLKPLRKRAYLALLRVAGLLNGVRLHATSEAEAQDLRAMRMGPVLSAPDLPPRQPVSLPAPRLADEGPLRLAFVSRIDANKNLLGALRALSLCSRPVQLDIAGPIGDVPHWQACQALMARLPGHVQTRWLGPLTHEAVLACLARQELFILPTWSENHGYVIQEALLAGCALLISDRTPWRGLQALGIGWDLPLDDLAFAQAVDRFAAMPPDERLAMREHAAAYGRSRLNASTARAATSALLQAAVRPAA